MTKICTCAPIGARPSEIQVTCTCLTLPDILSVGLPWPNINITEPKHKQTLNLIPKFRIPNFKRQAFFPNL